MKILTACSIAYCLLPLFAAVVNLDLLIAVPLNVHFFNLSF